VFKTSWDFEFGHSDLLTAWVFRPGIQAMELALFLRTVM
jgi:hypothetical protein